MNEEKALRQISRCGEELRPTPQELIDICREGIEQGKELLEIQKEIFAYCDRNPAQVEGTGRRGMGNLTMVDHLEMGCTVPECIRNDPLGCELDYMSNQQIKDHLADLERQTNDRSIRGLAEITKTQLENDKLYLVFKGRQ